MSIRRLLPEDFEYFTLELNPKRIYATNAISGITTGSVYMYPRRTGTEKDIFDTDPLTTVSESTFSDVRFDDHRSATALQTTSDIYNYVNGYMNAVSNKQICDRILKKYDVVRNVPPFVFNSIYMRKNIITNLLMPYYRSSYTKCHFNYTNYHCLNFFTASVVPANSVLLFPNPIRTNYASLTEYGFTGSFSFDFYIKPKYTTDSANTSFTYKPGCLFHLTSSYSVTLHSGSSKDINGRPDAFKLFLQLSSSTDVVPDQVVAQQTIKPWIFASEDNCLPINQWSHVTIRWGGTERNFGSGSFDVNGINRGYFVITSTLAGIGDQNYGDPSVLCVGNYYEGQNVLANCISHYFTKNNTTREGLYQLTGADVFAPSVAAFNYPLNAEVHDLKIYERYLTNANILALSSSGPKTTDPKLLFYLPPFFTEESPTRQFYLNDGGVPVSPYYSITGSTKHPFSTDMAFSCGGHYINLENYLREFKTGRYGKALNLTASITNAENYSAALAANVYLYSTSSIRKRLYTILPCDNGKFCPNYDFMKELTGSNFKDDLGIYDAGMISLRNLITGTYGGFGMVKTDESVATKSSLGVTTYNTSLVSSNAILDGVFGATPENPGRKPSTDLAVYNRMRDGNSNQIVMFEMSNMFYGSQIKPGTFKMYDTNMSGSGGRVTITLEDDGEGNLYRADCSGSHATWASVGNIFYNEGIILIKHPQLFFFGINEYYMEFEGTKNTYVFTVNCKARAGELVSSSNPSFGTGSMNDDLANFSDERYTWLTNCYLMDSDLNVLVKSVTAQPLIKRSSDQYLWRIKLDF